MELDGAAVVSMEESVLGQGQAEDRQEGEGQKARRATTPAPDAHRSDHSTNGPGPVTVAGGRRRVAGVDAGLAGA